MIKGLIALFVCVSVNLNIHATNLFLTGTKEVIVYCEYFDEVLLESKLDLLYTLSIKGFTCDFFKLIEGIEIMSCADEYKNNLYAGFAKDETSCLNDFSQLMEAFKRKKKPLPKITKGF